MKTPGTRYILLLSLVLASSLPASAIEIGFDGIITSTERGTGSGSLRDLPFSVSGGDSFHATYTDAGDHPHIDFYFGSTHLLYNGFWLPGGKPNNFLDARVTDDFINLSARGESEISYIVVDFDMAGPGLNSVADGLPVDASGNFRIWFLDYAYKFYGSVEHINYVSVADSASTGLLFVISLSLLLLFRPLKLKA